MARRIVAVFVLAIVAAASLAATREEDAKKYAADLKSKNAKVRLTALTELGKLGAIQRKLTEPYPSDIIGVLNDSDDKVRAEAARTLARIDPKEKKDLVEKLVELLKSEKSEAAREGQETGLGELGATSDDSEVKKMAREALLEARKKTDSKREQKTIQAALILIAGPKKKN